MSPIKIVIEGYPSFIAQTFTLKILGFYATIADGASKIRIALKPDNGLKAKMFFGAKCSTKLKAFLYPGTSGIFMKSWGEVPHTIYRDYFQPQILQFRCSIKDGASIIKQNVSDLSTIGIGLDGIKIDANKCYTVKTDATLGYWDDFTLSSMDNLTNNEIAGIIV
jgi:hypothetical protein